MYLKWTNHHFSKVILRKVADSDWMRVAQYRESWCRYSVGSLSPAVEAKMMTMYKLIRGVVVCHY